MKHRIVTAAQMKEIERAGDAHGLPYLQMMENAGLAAYAELHPAGPEIPAQQNQHYNGRAKQQCQQHTVAALRVKPQIYPEHCNGQQAADEGAEKTHKKLQPFGPDARTSGAGLQLFAFYNFYSPIGIVW